MVRSGNKKVGERVGKGAKWDDNKGVRITGLCKLLAELDIKRQVAEADDVDALVGVLVHQRLHQPRLHHVAKDHVAKDRGDKR
jgi:hypothetical protein